MALRLTRALCISLIICLLGSSCSQYTYVMGDDLVDANVGDWVGMSASQVFSTLGPPHKLSGTTDGYVLAWENVTVVEQSAGFSLGLLGLNALQADWGSAAAEGELVLVMVDRSWTVIDVSGSRWNRSVGDGAGVQPVAAIAPLVDVDNFLTPMPHHFWGANMLLPIHQAQNNAMRPDTGQSGIQQRGTPRAVGQRSLEFE